MCIRVMCCSSHLGNAITSRGQFACSAMITERSKDTATSIRCTAIRLRLLLKWFKFSP